MVSSRSAGDSARFARISARRACPVETLVQGCLDPIPSTWLLSIAFDIPPQCVSDGRIGREVIGCEAPEFVKRTAWNVKLVVERGENKRRLKPPMSGGVVLGAVILLSRKVRRDVSEGEGAKNEDTIAPREAVCGFKGAVMFVLGRV